MVIITDKCFFIVTFIVADSCLPFYYWCSFHFGMCKDKESLSVVSRSFNRLKLWFHTLETLVSIT